MLIKLNPKKGQTVGEFAILMGVIVAAAIAMQVYVRRGVQARIKDVYDHTRTANYTADSGTDATFETMLSTNQYEPEDFESSMETTQNGSKNIKMSIGGGIVTTVNRDTTERKGNTTHTYTPN